MFSKKGVFLVLDGLLVGFIGYNVFTSKLSAQDILNVALLTIVLVNAIKRFKK